MHSSIPIPTSGRNNQSVLCIYEFRFCLFVCLFLDSTYKWDLYLLSFSDISLSIMLSMSIHVVTKGKISFILWLNNIPLCTYTYMYITFSLSIHPLMVTACFHVLATVKLQWTLRCIYLFELTFLFPSDKYTEVELLDHMVVPFLIFEEPPYCFS